MRGAAESGTAQRGGAARASTTAHNSETQAQKGSGGDVSFPDHSGPGRPGRRGSRVRFCAPDERNTFPVGHPVGSGAEAPEIFWVLLYLYKSTSPGGETSPSPRPARRRYYPGDGGGRFPLSGGNGRRPKGGGTIPPVRGKCPEGTKGVGISPRPTKRWKLRLPHTKPNHKLKFMLPSKTARGSPPPPLHSRCRCAFPPGCVRERGRRRHRGGRWDRSGLVRSVPG